MIDPRVSMKVPLPASLTQQPRGVQSPKLRILLVSICLIGGCAAGSEPSATLPNVILFLLDDLGIHDLGVYGQQTTETPEIDRLAAAGMRFTEFRASSPVCSPTRIALLTGKSPIRSNARFAFHAHTRRGLDPADFTLAEVFKAKGYATGHIGKWHLGTLADQLPTDHGFDEYVLKDRGTERSSKYRDPAIYVGNGRSERAICLGPENPQHPASCERQPSGHLTDVITDYAVDFIDRHRRRPFFLNVWHRAPHMPYQPTREYLARYVEPAAFDDAASFCEAYSNQPAIRRSDLTPLQAGWIRACYRALITQADAGIAKIMRHLEDLGLADDTIVIVTSDNGLARTSRMQNGGFRGTKLTLFEGGLRVPLIVRWPGRIPAGPVSSTPLFTHDLLPTLAEIVDVAPRAADGRSFLALLTNGEGVPENRPWVWQLESVRGARNPGGPYDYAIRDAVEGIEYKLIATPATDGRAAQLFRIGSDPRELDDVAEDHRGVVDQLERRYLARFKELSRIPFKVAHSDGGASVDSNHRFTFAGGTIALAEEFRHRIDDRDFTLALRLRLAGGRRGARRPWTIAEHQGSWKLSVGADDRLRLVVHGVDKHNRTWRSEDPKCPSCIVLESSRELRGDTTHDLAFTVKGYSAGPSTVRLFVDSRLQAATTRLPKIAGGDGPIVFGGAGPDTLRGVISDLRIFGATLHNPTRG